MKHSMCAQLTMILLDEKEVEMIEQIKINVRECVLICLIVQVDGIGSLSAEPFCSFREKKITPSKTNVQRNE